MLLIDHINCLHVQTVITSTEVWGILEIAFKDKCLTRRVGLFITTFNLEDYYCCRLCK